MDGKSELQLLPGTKKRLGIRVKGENTFLYIGSAILGATLITMFALGRYQSSLEAMVKSADDQLIVLEKSRNKTEEQNLKLFKDRVQLTSNLLDSHVYWTKALSVITNLFQNNIRFKSFSGDVNTRSISIVVQVSNYSTLAKQVASFLTEAAISDLSIGKISPSTSGIIETSFSIKFDPVKLLQKTK